MKLYGRISSLNVQKVLWLLDELGIDYDHTPLGGRFGGLDDPDFVRLNPMKKVPVLVDDDHAVWESHTILRYLVASYGDAHWYPADPFQRSLYERWMDWAHLVFQPAFMATFLGYYRMPESKRDMGAVNQALIQCHECLAVIDPMLEQSDYVLGNTPSLADICLGVMMYRLTEQGLDVVLPPNVARWFALLKTRSGYRKWVMSDFSELAAREDY